jgi:hypothetical protein
MQSRQSFYLLLGIVLIIALAMLESGVPPSAEAQQGPLPPAEAQHVPLPPQSPFITIIQPGGMKGERYGLDISSPGNGTSRTAPSHTEDRFPRGHAKDR